MKEEIKLTEMIQEMDNTFRERESIFKERDEAFQQRYQTFLTQKKKLEEDILVWESTREAMEKKDQNIKSKEEELAMKEENLKKDQDEFKSYFEHTMSQLDEERIRLNLMRLRISNEQARQQSLWLGDNNVNFPSEDLVNTVKSQEESLDDHKEIHPIDPEPEGKTLQDMIIAQEKIIALEEKNKELEKEITALEGEKQDLFRKLLGMNEENLSDSSAYDEDKTISGTKTHQKIISDSEGVGESQTEDELSPMDEIHTYYENQDANLEPLPEEDSRIGFCLKREKYYVDILDEGHPVIQIHYPAESRKRVLKNLLEMNGEDEIDYHYDHNKKEIVVTVPFRDYHAPEDIENYIRCFIDYEIPVITGKGG